MPKLRDVTQQLIEKSSSTSNPGAKAALFRRAAPAKKLTPSLAKTLASWERKPDRTMGFTSNPLIYSGAMPRGAREHANTIRLIKGGHLRVCEVLEPPPVGSTAKRDSPYGDRYYLIRPGACGDEAPSGALAGRQRRRR